MKVRTGQEASGKLHNFLCRTLDNGCPKMKVKHPVSLGGTPY
jgi:hypothetical protein